MGKQTFRRPGAEPADALSFTLQRAAALSGLSIATLRRRGKSGALRLFRCGRRRLVDGNSLRRMLGVRSDAEGDVENGAG